MAEYGRRPLPAAEVIALGLRTAGDDACRLGALLYEAATGRPPDPVAVPPLRLNPDLPPELDRILMRALDPEPGRRYPSAADLRLDLQRLQRKAPARVDRRPARRSRVRTALYAAAALALVWAGNWVFDRLSRPSRSAARPVPLTNLPGAEIQPSFSPDGAQVAFAWQTERRGDTFHVYVKPVGSGAPRRLTSGTANDVSPACSPDGRLIAFLRMGPEQAAYYLVPAGGGVERKLADYGPAELKEMRRPAIAWTPDSRSLVLVVRPAGQPAALALVPAEGGPARRLTSPPAPPGDGVPALSPDGARLAFARASAVAAEDIYVAALAGGEPRRITFDNRPVQGLAWTADGRRLLYSCPRAGAERLWVMPASGGSPVLAGTALDAAVYPTFSRAGSRLAYASPVADVNIWRLELAARTRDPVRWIAWPRAERDPQYSPDGKRVAFISERSGTAELWLADAEGEHPVQLSQFKGPVPGAPRWSADGTRLVFQLAREGFDPEVWTAPAAGGAAPQRVAHIEAGVLPSWSRDGRWIYFSRRGQIWKTRAAGGEAVQVTRLGGGGRALESADGKFLYYGNRGTVWWMPLAGEDESPLFGELRARGGAWALGRRGIWFLQREGPGKTAIRYFDLAARSVETVGLIDAPPGPDLAGFTVSPDGRYALYCQMDRSDSDLVLVENFR